MNTIYDVLVVGSGPSGAQAAQTLVEEGLRVAVVDVGYEPGRVPAVPERPFGELRAVDAEQHAYFLGEDFSGIPRARVGAAPQVMPTRGHVFRTAPAHAVETSEGFAALESHALGGLGGAWGAVSFPLLDQELDGCGLPRSEMRRSYERVAQRIGISGERDDLCAVRGPLETLQDPLAPDHNGCAVLERYGRERAWFQRAKIVVGRPLLAVLSRNLGDRRAHPGLDLDFWSNPGGSVYRPELTIAELRSKENFIYHGGWVVETFSERSDSVVQVVARSRDSSERRTFVTRRLVLAAGSLGTTRIALSSLGDSKRKLPLACNAHLYVPCLRPAQWGRAHAERCHSLAQVTMVYDSGGDGAHLTQAQMYSYRSLHLFRLLGDVPLPQREALWVLRALAPSLAIWAIEHEDVSSPGSYCRMTSNGRLEVVHRVDPEVERRRRADERAMMRGMRRLGLWPLRRVHSGHGSSLHYGGQLPMGSRDEPMTCEPSGRLRGTRSVYVVDGAALRYLPAKGPTFTLMANADRVARGVAAELASSVGA